MKLQTILLGIILAVGSPLLVFGCGNITKNTDKNTELPKEMPAETEMSYSENGGMSPAYKSINISDNTLTIKEKTFKDQTDTIRHSEISVADKTELYQAFVDNKFDLIKNDERGEIVYDAPSSGISIRAGDKNCRVSEGDNFPLSGTNSKHFFTVRDAFNKLEAKYKDSAQEIKQNYAVIKYDKKAHAQIFKNAKYSVLSGDEIVKLDKLIAKAVEEHNAKTNKYQKIENLSEYKFQYIPIQNDKITNGMFEKEVWVNAFCNGYDINWKKQIVAVDDGGSCFFNLKINLTNSTIYDFQVNGMG